MKTDKFVLKGVELTLDVNDIVVDERIEKAMGNMVEGMQKVTQREGSNSLMLSIVHVFRIALNEIFDRTDAADLLLDGVTRFDEIMDVYTETAKQIGAMRSVVFADTAAKMQEAVAAMKLPKK